MPALPVQDHGRAGDQRFGDRSPFLPPTFSGPSRPARASDLASLLTQAIDLYAKNYKPRSKASCVNLIDLHVPGRLQPSAAEIATTMHTSTASVNSPLQPPRKIAADKAPPPPPPPPLPQIHSPPPPHP